MAISSVLIILAAGESIPFYEFYKSRHSISWFDQEGKKCSSEMIEEFWKEWQNLIGSHGFIRTEENAQTWSFEENDKSRREEETLI